MPPVRLRERAPTGHARRARRPPVMQSARHPLGADAKRMGRRPRIHANPLQDLPIAVLSVFNGLEQKAGLLVSTCLGKQRM